MPAFWGGQPSYDFEEQERCVKCGAFLSPEKHMRDDGHGGEFEDTLYICKNPRCSSKKQTKRT